MARGHYNKAPSRNKNFLSILVVALDRFNITLPPSNRLVRVVATLRFRPEDLKELIEILKLVESLFDSDQVLTWPIFQEVDLWILYSALFQNMIKRRPRDNLLGSDSSQAPEVPDTVLGAIGVMGPRVSRPRLGGPSKPWAEKFDLSEA